MMYLRQLTDWLIQTDLAQLSQTDNEADLINCFDHSCAVLNIGPILVKSVFANHMFKGLCFK